jgi:hypothetical protein
MAYTLVETEADRPDGLNGGTSQYSGADMAYIVSRFDVALPVAVTDFVQKGNINTHTYLVKAGDGREYLLQKVNSDVFTRPYRVMDSMVACLNAQRKVLDVHSDFWEPITLVPTRQGKAFLDISDEHGWSVWRLMHRIADVNCYKSLSVVDPAKRMYYAEEVGRGLALYGDLTAEMPRGLPSPLPGYRHTDIYFNQLDAVLAGVRNPSAAEPYLPDSEELRDATGLHFLLHLSPEEALARRAAAKQWIDFIQAHRPQAMVLFNQLESGRIRRMMIHGDTKIENFLFCAHSGRVKSLIDLDTIVPGTWLADWGDMVRSLVNVAGETETDLSLVTVDEDVYEAVTRGFLSTTTQSTPDEIALMPHAVLSITLELGARFLADYLRGDSYFRVADGSSLNLTRAAVQFTLAKCLMAHSAKAETLVGSYLA